MKKPFRHHEVSPTRKCKDCHKPLKMNLLAKNIDADTCWKCDKTERKARIKAQAVEDAKNRPTILKDVKKVFSKYASKRLS